MFANPQIETCPRDELQKLQLASLKKILCWAMEKSFYYQQSFKQAGVNLNAIESLEDIRKLPFTTVATLHSVDSLDMLTLPLSNILRFNHIMTECDGVTKCYTNGDIARNVEMLTRALVAMGITGTSIVGLQGDLSDSRLLDIQYALEVLGVTVISLGTNYEHWLRLMEIVGMDTIISTPRLIMQLIIQLQANGKNIADYPVEKIVCINPNHIQNQLQRHIQDRTQTRVFNLYAPPEIGSASMLFQCDSRRGFHINEDFFLTEIIAFDGKDPIIEDGRMGELVVTTLKAEAMPLIRFRTGQAVRYLSEPCECHRTLARIASVNG